jgi:hypothetical protein
MNAERRTQNAERTQWRRRTIGILFGSAFCVLTSAFPASAAPSQEDVFRSIQQNVGKRSEDSGKGLAILAAGAGGLIMVMLVGSKLRRRQAAPKSVNHAGRLLREVMKSVPLKPKELKQLKLLAEESRRDGAEPVESPLTFLLCPSVLAKTLKSRPAKVDRAVLAQVVRKMGAGVK